MSKEASAAEQVPEGDGATISAQDVADYLRKHPDFFVDQDELLAELRLPHESGKAISLLERQVTILRERSLEARQKLNVLLDNARNNDQLFDTTRNLVLALLRADSATAVADMAQDQLTHHANIDACEVILIERPGLNVSNSVRVETEARLKDEFEEVYRLKRTYCGRLLDEQVAWLFGANAEQVKSTALTPVMHDDEIVALLVFGNNSDNYFNINLDTLFLDFIGRVVGAVLDKQTTAPI